MSHLEVIRGAFVRRLQSEINAACSQVRQSQADSFYRNVEKTAANCAFEEAIRVAVRELHTENPDMLAAALRRSGLVVRSGVPQLHH